MGAFSSVHTPAEDMGYEAAKILYRMILGKRVPRTTELTKIQIVARESTVGTVRLSGDIDDVLAYIEQHACSGISVEELPKLMGVSRRMFQEYFLKQVGHTPMQEIQRVRLERAKTLLRQTQLSIGRIAIMVGFDEQAAFGKFFRQQTKLTPREYRIQNSIDKMLEVGKCYRYLIHISKLQPMKSALLILFFSLATVRAAEQPKPNIVFIFSDDHAVQATGAYPSWLNTFIKEQKVTPNIDQLAKDGVVFANSFCANSICAPSRATILTGKHSYQNGVTRWQEFNGTQSTFPKLLQKAGYQTAIIGKWHLVSQPTGFDLWRVLPGQGAYYNPEFITPMGKERVQGYVTDIITDKALNWLDKERDATKPFMLMIHHKAPHRNWGPAPKYAKWLDDVKIPEPPTLFDDYNGRTPSASKQEMEIDRHMTLKSDLKIDPAEFAKLGLSGKEAVRWKYQRYMQDYLRCVKSVDDSVGRVREHLQRTGLEKNTVVIYCSDQGFYLGEHGWFDKRWMYEESLRMPLIVSWPGVTNPGERPAQLVQNIDYAPTFLAMAGLTAPEEMQGTSLVPLLRGEKPSEWRKSIYYHYYDCPAEHRVECHEGVRTEQYKLINFYRPGDWELYDLVKDPNEMHSIHDDPSYAKTLSELKVELVRLKKQHGLPENPAK